MDKSILQSLAQYNAYANNLVLEVASRMDRASLFDVPSQSHGSIFLLLVHMLRAETFFLAGCRQEPAPHPDLNTLDELLTRWSVTSRDTQAYLASIDPTTLAGMREVILGGKPFHFPVWQLILQAIVHSIHHRGELAILMSKLGYPLPTLDIIIPFAEASNQPWSWD